MKTNCAYCNKDLERTKARAKGNCYCTASCQMHYEYKNGIRDKVKTGIKARAKAAERDYDWLKNKSESHLEGIRAPRPNHIPYNKQFPTKIWWAEVSFKRLRPQVLERDNHACVTCGVKETEKQLYCDHKIPYQIVKEHKLENLQMLCGSCHSRKTNKDMKLMKAEGIL